MADVNYKPFDERFGYEIRLYRIVHRIRQAEFAKKFNITRSNLSCIEKGKVSCSIAFFGRLVEVVGPYAIYMFMRAYFGNGLRGFVKRTCYKLVQNLFDEWLKCLEKKEPVNIERTYDNDNMRVKTKYNNKGKSE